jgi:beta-lactamase class A
MLRFAAFAFACLAAAPATADWDTAKLDREIVAIEAQSKGRLGVALLDLKDRKSWSHRGSERFPMQSVFKFPLAVAVLQAVEAGRFTLDQPIRVERNELALFWSPLKKSYRAEAPDYALRDLIARAAGESDNTAADVLMRRIGGPAVVTAMLKQGGLTAMSVDRYEREFQPEVHGLPAFGWDAVIDDASFEAAVAATPTPARRQAFARAVSDEMRDTATPEASIAFLEGWAQGTWLREQKHRDLLDAILTETPTGRDRIRAGLPAGARFAQKTGSGGSQEGVNHATNDIGVVALPDGRRFAIAVYLAGSSADAAGREAAHAAVARLAIAALR